MYTKEEIVRMNQENLEYKGEMISEVVLDMSLSYIQRCRQFLDIGAGNGALIKTFRKYWPDSTKYIEGIDLVPCDVVKEGDCTQLNYDNESFNCIFCTDVIEHLSDENLKKCISEIHRVLRAGGYLIVTTVNNENLERRKITCPECGRRFHPYGHCQVFNREELKGLFGDFKIIKIKELNLGFVSSFGFIAKAFYFMRLHKIKPVQKIINDFFVVCQKVKK